MNTLAATDLADLAAFLAGCRGAQVHIAALEQGDAWCLGEPAAPRFHVQLIFAIPELLDVCGPTLEGALARLAAEVRSFVADLPDEVRRQVSP